MRLPSGPTVYCPLTVPDEIQRDVRKRTEFLGHGYSAKREAGFLTYEQGIPLAPIRETRRTAHLNRIPSHVGILFPPLPFGKKQNRQGGKLQQDRKDNQSRNGLIV
jgi:hypothetical protein